MARRLGADDATLSALADYARSPLFTRAEKAAFAAAAAITHEPRGLPEPVWRGLREHFDDGQIVEIICTIGLFNYFNRVNNALEVEPTQT